MTEYIFERTTTLSVYADSVELAQIAADIWPKAMTWADVELLKHEVVLVSEDV